jgi:hypothetical protein
MPFQDWVQRDDTVFHGSHRADWHQHNAHVGTQAAASDRLLQVAANTVPNDPDSSRGKRHPRDMAEGGRIWARRLAEPLAMTSHSDSALNVAQRSAEVDPDKLYSEERHPSASSDDESDLIKSLGKHIRAGHPVGYKNAFEDTGSISALAPPGTMRTWSQDVAEAHAQGLDVHPHDLTMSKQFDPHIEIKPKSMGMAAERFMLRDQQAPRQQTMFPYSVGDKLFETRATDVDKDNWSTHVPGLEAAKRAQAFATETDQKIGLGVHQRYDPPEFPSGITRAPRIMGNH